jgi:signal transduction histidine kinase
LERVESVSMTPEPAITENLHAIGVLTRSTTHDLNNYMAAIMSFAELVLEAMPESHPLRNEVHGILNASHRAIVKTRELNEFASKLAPIGLS